MRNRQNDEVVMTVNALERALITAAFLPLSTSRL